MPGAFRTLVRLFGAVALSFFSWSEIQAAAPVDTAQKPTFLESGHRGSAGIDAGSIDSVNRTLASKAPLKRDSLSQVQFSRDSIRADSLKSSLPDYQLQSPWENIEACRMGVEGASECWRRNRKMANMELGFPGTRGYTLSLTNWQPVPVSSPFFPAWKHSPYLNGGMAPFEQFAVQSSGGDVQGLEEIWTPVIPLDTPITRLNWERGPLTLNIFDLRLRRMLGDRVYLALDYYSSSADSQTYDYQFNVHQPYLGGLGVIGQIYGPIDRDSASLVLEGVSYQIEATSMRPRIGFWLDTSRVLEVFFDHLKNSTSLALPTGPKSIGGVNRPGAADSMQALVPASMSSTSEGLIYGESHRLWALQWEGSHTSLTLNEFRSGDTLSIRSGVDELQANIFKLRGHWLGTGIMGKPSLSLESRSETWEGIPVLTRGTAQTSGWTDAQDLAIGFHPTTKLLDTKFDGGLTRISRMDNQVKWLNRYGGAAKIDLPLGFESEGGYVSRMQDPEWEILYRTNPARFRYASPKLEPRTYRSFRGSLAWSKGRFSLDGGLDFLRREEAWLPRVLPNSGVCKDLADSVYSQMPSQRCLGDTSGSKGSLPDSLALALRNYDQQAIDAWHLGLGFGLGNWDLQLRNRFVIHRQVTDAHLANSRPDLSVPERVFKGRLSWKRSLVDDKLKLDLSWDWEWFSTRYGWVPDQTGNSKVGKLDEYLALDFQAAMQIKTFTLFFRSMNMNHDRYATEAGVHPPGINFRFGVDWTLSN